MAGLISSDDLVDRGVETDEQMVTVLPVTTEDVLYVDTEAEACAIAGRNYDIAEAQNAIFQANLATERTDGAGRLTGRGPFLIAWSPGTSKGKADTVALVADLSNSTSPEQIAADIRTWVDLIQQEPELWRRGWNIEAFRIAGQRWIDRRAAGILKLIGDFS